MATFDWDQLLESPQFNMGAGLLAGAGAENQWGTALNHLNQYQRTRALSEQRRQQAALYEQHVQRSQEEMRMKQEAAAQKQLILNSIKDPNERALAAMDMGEYAKSKLTRQKPMVVGAGDTLVDPTTRESLFQAPAAPPKPGEFASLLEMAHNPNLSEADRRAVLQRIQMLSTHAPSASIRVENYPQPMPAINPQTGKVELTQFGSQGTPRPTGFAPVPPGSDKPPTNESLVAQGYLSRMQAAEQIMGEPGLQGAQGPTPRESLTEKAFGADITNLGLTAKRQPVRQAQQDWVRAKLRKESGAVIATSEMNDEVATYFPRLGDSNAVIAQKRAARREAEKQLMIQGGVKGPATPAAPTAPAFDYDAIPKGQAYTAPDGSRRIKR